MSTLVIVGAQWGDEGKGKVVDLLSEKAQVVVRYAGGPNAGHTLVVGDDKIVLRLIPSGVLHPHVFCVLGQGMVLNPAVLLEEIDALETRGHQVRDRMIISDRAHLILPYHVALDGLRETSQQGTKIGTTKRGIGPCYEDKAARRGVRTADLRDPAHLRHRVEEALATWAPTFAAFGKEVPPAEPIVTALLEQAKTIVPLLRETSRDLDDRIRAGAAVMLEGAQGTLLDLDHGTYPYVTSSSAVAGGACTGAGVGPSRIDRVLGITKAYTTRVGEGPFPTELDDEAGQYLRDQGHEYGSVTGRPRRTGWLDVAALRYAARVNGLDALALTKLDVLTGLDEIKLGVAYEAPDGPTDALPSGRMDDAVAVYETLPGWTEDLTACRSLDELPAAARAYLDRISERCELPIDLVSVGPRRDQTIVVRPSFP